MTSPLDHLYDKSENEYSFGFTINVSPKKYVNGVQFGNLSSNWQEEVIYDACLNALKYADVFEFDHYFELTKKGIPHLHGCCKCTLTQIKAFQLAVHRELGMPSLKPNICCDYSKTLVDINAWKRYMNKTNANYVHVPKSPADDIDFID